ncbi:FHA domain-containing protein [Sedimentisphaera salicampi]|uniref:ABC transporter ATP-binding/permease protein n=1 Tax=Sedimentisphaera salicampi TaxID=1941349 RepID=A0A1W6LL81_9BACT|nr:FHA domain-containing protein [Sedimentisphaera salicampi]ARN56515.1 ABC transporter ATP-binding/permease protein [Sedimentisphaera salicampi]OXU15398.1 ABC transporter ATP-binding/permease protein [Sedimentisphaera salicampi]
MNLTVLKDGESVNELRFDSGPIRVGREIGSEVFLPDSSVSRKHAVIYNDDDNNWVIEDQHSSNGTKINGKEIWKAILKPGDVINISCFELRPRIHKDKERPRAAHLEDTVVEGLDVSDSVEIKSRDIITRNMRSDDNPMLRLSNERFRKIREHLADVLMIDETPKLLEYWVRTVIKDLHACHCWAGVLNSEATSVLESYGRNRDSTKVTFDDIKLNNHIIYSIKQMEHVLVPRMLRANQKFNLRSALIVSFVLEDNTRFAAYVDNTCEQEHYAITDLDYLVIFGETVAAKIDAVIKKSAEQ